MGALFALFAGFYYWFGKITGYSYDETLGKMHFWMTFVGVNLTFFPQHFLGMAGMPRRIPDYPDAFAQWNLISSIGSSVSIAGLLFFVYVVYKAFAEAKPAPKFPWALDDSYSQQPTTLEWVLSSPPAFHTFEELPRVKL